MKIENINKAADILYNSRINLKRIQSLPLHCNPNNKNEAYSIQETLIKKYLSVNTNSSVIGKKVGCTNKTAQEQINVKEPFYGNLLSNYSSKSNFSLKSDNFFGPFVEPEFSFKIKHELNPSKFPYSFDEVYKSIDSVLPSIEIVDSRFNDWTKVGIYNLIADNAVNAYWIYGNNVTDIKSFDFSNHSVNLYINDNYIKKGNSKNVLNNPINSLTWLVNTLTQDGKILHKNSYVSTGTCTPAIPIYKNNKIVADFGKLGKVKFDFL